MIPEFSNKLVHFGNQVVFGNLLFWDAIEAVKQDYQLKDLSDNQLKNLIREANHYWFYEQDPSSVRPENLLIYPFLTEACAKTRLKSIGQFRQGFQGEERQQLDRRMATWITIVAECLLQKGMVLLLPNEPKSLPMALQTFSEAYVVARTLPDFGQLRLREVLWANCGLLQTSRIRGQSQLAENAWQELAGQELNALTQIPGRQEEARTYISEIEAEFKRLLNAKRGRTEYVTVDLNTSGENDQREDYEYNNLLTSIGEKIITGKLSIEQGKQKVLEAVRDKVPNSQIVDTITQFIKYQLSLADPKRAILLLELNYIVAKLLTDEFAEITLAYCALAIANAKTINGRKNNNILEYQQAIPYWEKALKIFSASNKTPPEHLTEIYLGLALCYRGVGEFEQASKTNYKAIKQLETLQNTPEGRINLGVAIGNLGDVQAQMGDVTSAFENHYRAFQIFSQEKDFSLIQQALSEIVKLAVQSGRIDDAIAALESTALLAKDLTRIKVVVKSYLQLIPLAWGIGRLKEALDAGSKAEKLLKFHISQENRDREYLKLYYDLLILRGSLYVLLVNDSHTVNANKVAFKQLEKARQIAIEISDNNRLSISLIQLAKLFSQLENFEAAESYCYSLDLVKDSFPYHPERDSILGEIQFKQQQYQDAVASLKRAINGHKQTSRSRKLYTIWYRLGQACYELGDFQSAIKSLEKSLALFEQNRLTLFEESRIDLMTYGVEIYNYLIALYADSTKSVFNPKKALFWLEKSKARTFVETIGLSVLPLHNPPGTIQSKLVQERELLYKINQLRGDLFFSREEKNDKFKIQQQLKKYFNQLDEALNKIAEYCPEYVELRRGDVVEWNEFKSFFD